MKKSQFLQTFAMTTLLGGCGALRDIAETNNGKPGADGASYGVILLAATSAQCAAGGSVIVSYQDHNQNGLLDEGETQLGSSVICNGASGANGADGVAGINGINGSNGTDGVDGTNGTNGTNAVFFMGPVGNPVDGKPYSACHHDYLYIPDPTGGDRGWLTFRHQKNGSADQGIGSTGFQVWNVDISDFSLASENGSHAYCTLHWDALTRILDFTVVDSDDGLAGTQGSIRL